VSKSQLTAFERDDRRSPRQNLPSFSTRYLLSYPLPSWLAVPSLAAETARAELRVAVDVHQHDLSGSLLQRRPH
jgi:hypothetical protein